MIKPIILSGLLMVLLCACGLPGNLTPPTTKTTGVFQTPTFIPLLTVTSSASIQSPPADILRYNCLNITPNLPTNANLSGRLILDGRQPYYFDFKERTLESIPDKRGDLVVSPNGKWLAYYEISNDSPTGMWLTIESANGQQKRLPMQDWFWGINALYWLDNQRLVYNVWNRNHITPIYPVAVINPFTGKTQELASDYPNLIPSIIGPAGTMHFIFSTVVYDPSLDLVVYPETNSDGDFVVLWDRQSQIQLAKLYDLSNFHDTPMWLPDGSQFVVYVSNSRGNDGWFAINRKGEIRQLTHFEDFFEKTEIRLGKLSPNGRFLAFWLVKKPSMFPMQSLVVLDLETLQVTDYCIPGSIRNDAEQPVWSPDSRYIVIANYYATNSFHAILVDPFDEWAARIAEDLIPRGWMIAP